MVGVDEVGLWAVELETAFGRVAGRISRVDLRWRMREYVRSLTRPQEIAYFLAYASNGTTVADLVRVAGTRWAIEEAFQAAKNECGLDQYEVRRYVGWYRHITLAMLAHATFAALTAQTNEKGAAETTPPALPPSPWQRSDGCWQAALPASASPRLQRSRLEMVTIPTPPPGHRPAMPLQASHQASRTPATWRSVNQRTSGSCP